MKVLNVFYCWQSDSPLVTNCELIENALKSAINSVNQSNQLVQYSFEKDTLNVTGSPDIPNAIFEKIASSVDIMICDISITNPNFKGKKNPNSNVLLELGYAASIIGWENIITIFNKAYGSYSNLPFDIRSRKPIEYELHYQEKKSKFNEQEDLLNSKLKTELLTISKTPVKFRIKDAIEILTRTKWISIGNNPKESKFQGEAFIKHFSGKNFEFLFQSFETGERYENGDWNGILTLNDNFTFSGTIHWELSNQTNYGKKEFFLKEDESNYYLYLVPLNMIGQTFQQEVFKREKNEG